MKKIIPSPENTDQALGNCPKRVKEALNDLRISLEDLLIVLKDIPQNDIELLENLGIRKERAEALVQAQNFSAQIISYNNKRKNDTKP